MRIKLNNVRLSFPDLFTPRGFNGGEEKFSAVFLIEKGSALDKEVRAAILAKAKEKWGAKGEQIVRSIQGNPNKFCYQDGDTKAYDGYAGMMALKANNKVRPLVLDVDRSPLVQADGKPYAGCYVNASVEFFTYDNSGNGISASLRGVQFLRDGDAFGGGSAASEDEFDDINEGAMAGDLV